jgi:hypothetical protein
LRPDISIALGPEGMERRGLIRVPALRRICAEHYSGRKNHSTRLWTLLVLERWFARYQPEFVV